MDLCFGEQKHNHRFYLPGKDRYCRNSYEDSLVLFSRFQTQGLTLWLMVTLSADPISVS